MGNISSLALFIGENTTPMFDMEQEGGLSPRVAAGIMVATRRALFLTKTSYYKWVVKNMEGGVINSDKLLRQYQRDHQIDIEDIMVSSCGTIGYSVWIKRNAVVELKAERYLFENEELTAEFLQGIISAVKYFNIKIEDVLIGKVIRLRILDGQYIASYFNIDDLQLPSYEFGEDQLTVQCNFGRTPKLLKDRLDSLRAYLVIKYMNVHAPSAKVLIDKLMTDAETIFKYTLEENDITTMEMYKGFAGDDIGPKTVDSFLSKFDLK